MYFKHKFIKMAYSNYSDIHLLYYFNYLNSKFCICFNSSVHECYTCTYVHACVFVCTWCICMCVHVCDHFHQAWAHLRVLVFYSGTF